MLFRSPLRYSQSWEDYNVIKEALDIRKNDIIVCILSSGDNFLNLLCSEPKLAYGFDKNLAQIHEVKLKLVAIKNLEYEDFIKLLGYVGEGKERIKIFFDLANKLDEDTYKFWKKHLKIIRRGMAFQGHTEKKYSLFKNIIKFLLGNYYQKYIYLDNKEDRKKIYEKKINRLYLKILSRLFMNRIVIRFIYHKDLIKNLPPSFDYYKLFWEKLERIFVDIGCANNPYMFWQFTGEILSNQDLWQPYLKKENYNILKSNIDKTVVIQKDIYDGLKDIDDGIIDAFYLSDIFDWMNFDEMEKVLREILRVSKPGAKIVSFVIMQDKELSKNLEKNFRYNQIKSRKLVEMDRVGFYPKIDTWVVDK